MGNAWVRPRPLLHSIDMQPTFVAISAHKLALRRVVSYVRHERRFAREGLVAQRAGALLVEYQIHLKHRK